MSDISCASGQGLTGISLCSPVVSTRRPLPLLLPSGVVALKHLFKEAAKLCSGQLAGQQNDEDREILEHASCKYRLST